MIDRDAAEPAGNNPTHFTPTDRISTRATLDGGPSPRAGKHSVGKPTAGKGERTKSSILLAAIDRFGRDGFRSTSIADIARDAGVGGSVAYSYFPNKAALFIEALEADATALIDAGVSALIAQPDVRTWRDALLSTLLGSIPDHPLVRRVLAGREPEVTDRVMELPAMLRMRAAVVERVRTDQLSGIVRSDIDPKRVGNGSTTIILTIVMAAMQFGPAAVEAYGPDIWAVFDAVYDPPRHD